MYELSSVLAGHSADVRCCCLDAAGHIITGSRDKTAIVWGFDEDTTSQTPAPSRWKVLCKLTGHNGFVNAIATLKATEDFPQGLIVTGGQDRMINVYMSGSSEPLRQLAGHEEGITCLSTGWNGTILSGAADKTVRVWDEHYNCVEVLKGHEGPIWDVSIFPGTGTYLSASGDKTIRFWEGGKAVKVFRGHADAVRSVAVMPDSTFLSCSNDGTVRQWHIESGCINTITVSSSFLYSISLLSEGFVVSGEDGNLFIYKDKALSQSIKIPAVSAWCCAPLPFNEILVGGSDGIARIFTSDEERYAPLADRDTMSQQLASQKHSTQTLGDLELSKLKGPEALNEPGREGQTLMINRAGTVEVYQWATGSWTNLGVVQDAYDKDKHELEGVKYDHVIDVDVQEGTPALKLGVNKDDDPWVVAQEFINKHLLPQVYLTQISEYITQNTGVGSKPMELDPEYCDPLTGSGRYVPGNSNTATVLGTPRYFPENKMLSEAIPDASKLIKKIVEHNQKAADNRQLNGTEIDHFEKVANKTSDRTPLSPDDMVIVNKLLSWEESLIFPAIDLLRSINKTFPEFVIFSEKVRYAVNNYQKEDKACVRVSLRLLVDITHQHPQLCITNFSEVIAPAVRCVYNDNDNKFVCLSLMKVLYNMTCADSFIDTAQQILDNVTQVLRVVNSKLEEKDKQSPQFQLTVAIGNLITRHPDLKSKVPLDLVNDLKSAKFDKTRIAATDISNLVR